MLIVREHAGRYVMSEADGRLIGLIIQGPMGWGFRNARGHGPRQPRSSAWAALELAATFGFIAPSTSFRELVRLADGKFNHNQDVARETAR